MFWRRALAVLLLCCLCGSLAGCGQDDAFVAAVSGIPNTLDPQLADSDVEYTVAVNLFEGLFRLNEKGEAVPAACRRYTVSEDGLLWAFYLKEDLHYNDGDDQTPPTPLTADDFAFALQRLFSAGNTSPYRDAFMVLDGAAAVAAGEADVRLLGVRAYQDDLLLIRLAVPDPTLPAKLACPAAMPCNRAFYESTEGTYGLSTAALLTNGAFRLTLWSEENGVTLRRIQPTEGLVNRVRLLPESSWKQPDAAARLAAGDASCAFLPGLDENGDGFTVRSGILLFHCGTTQLANVDIRAGLAGVALQNLPADYPPAGGLVPAGLRWGEQSWRAVAGDAVSAALPPDAAAAYRAGLAALGRDKLSGITVLVPDTDAWRSVYQTVALAWQQQLSAFFSVQYLPEEEVAARVMSGDYQIALLTLSAPQDDVAAVLAAFTAVGARQLTSFDDETSAALLRAAAGCTDSAQRTALLVQAEASILQSWPAVPLYAQPQHFALAPGFDGVVVSPFGPLMDFTNATEE